MSSKSPLTYDSSLVFPKIKLYFWEYFCPYLAFIKKLNHEKITFHNPSHTNLFEL